MALHHTKPIGWRSKIGVIVPPSNTVNEAEFNASLRRRQLHFTRRLPFRPGNRILPKCWVTLPMR